MFGLDSASEVGLSHPSPRSSRAVIAGLPPLPDPGWRRYALAVVAAGAMLLFRAALTPALGERLPFITFFFAVFVSAWYGGLGPALLATLIGSVASLFILYPASDQHAELDRVAMIGSLLFTLTGIAVGWMGETRLRALRLAAEAAGLASVEARRADEERERAEDEAAKAEEAAAEAETAAQEAAENLDRQLEAERAMRRSEQELSDLFEHATIGISVIGSDGVLRRANQALLEMLRCTVEDCVGRRFAELHEDPTIAEELLRRLSAGGEVREVPSRMRFGDREPRDVLVSASAYLEDGRFEHARCFVRDVTEQQRAEEAVRSLQRLESVGRLAGGMAHEVNNQMTVVLGAADFILRRNDVAPVVRADVQFIRDAAQRSASITTQLLAFSRRQILRPEVLDLRAALTAFEPVLQRSVGGACAVTLELAPAVANVRVDRGQLEQVLLNLALNAGDAMPEGGRLTLSVTPVQLADGDRRLPLESDVHGGPYVELVVRDTGSGMDAATLARVFEPFFTTKGPGKGTGLGLSTVYGIVRQSGGYIGVTSAPGQGTAFAIYLPSADLPARPGGRGRPGDGTRATVLLVEDQADVRQVAARALAEAGFAVREAADGEAALTQLDRSVRLVVTDLELPRMDGLDLARELGRRRPSLPVLLVSGHPLTDPLRRAAVADGYQLLEKPFTAEMLVRRVRQALDGLGDHAGG